jgi:DNA-binding MarR family transcriptional regulator
MIQEPDKEELVEIILELGDKAFRELFPILPKEWLRLDMTMPQLKVVLLLFLNGPSRMSVIASALGISLATATGVVDRLVEHNFVLREGDPEDRRVVLCRLSDKGERLISRLWLLSRERAKELLKAIPMSQLLFVKEAVETLLKAGEAMEGELQDD